MHTRIMCSVEDFLSSYVCRIHRSIVRKIHSFSVVVFVIVIVLCRIWKVRRQIAKVRVSLVLCSLWCCFVVYCSCCYCCCCFCCCLASCATIGFDGPMLKAESYGFRSHSLRASRILFPYKSARIFVARISRCVTSKREGCYYRTFSSELDIIRIFQYTPLVVFVFFVVLYYDFFLFLFSFVDVRTAKEFRWTNQLKC